MKNRDPLFLASALLLVTVISPRAAQAASLRPPAQIDAMPARMLIALRVSGDDRANFVAWQTGLSGEGQCYFERISDPGALPEDVSIFGTQGDNHVLMQPELYLAVSVTLRFCGHDWLPPQFGRPAEPTLAVYGEGGNDVIVTGLQWPPPGEKQPWPELHGGAGNDTIVAQQARAISGDEDDDFILSWFNPTGVLDGGSGKDKLCWGNDTGLPPAGPEGIDGGADVDSCFGSSPSFAGCENHAAFYPTSNPDWFKRECLTPAKAAQVLFSEDARP